MIEDKYNFIVKYGINHECQSIRDVLEKNILTNEKLHDSFELFNLILTAQSDSNWSIRLFIALISALVGAFSAFLFNKFHWLWVDKKKKETETFSKLSKIISDFETLSVEYWTKDHSIDDEKNEVYIKSKIRLLQKYIRAINTKEKSIKDELDDFVSDIFDLATGDDFESNERKSSKSKAISISYKCADINVRISSFI